MIHSVREWKEKDVKCKVICLFRIITSSVLLVRSKSVNGCPSASTSETAHKNLVVKMCSPCSPMYPIRASNSYQRLQLRNSMCETLTHNEITQSRCPKYKILTVMLKCDFINKIVGIIQDEVNRPVFNLWLIDIELEEHVICRCRFFLDG